VETITVSQAGGGSSTVDVGFYVAGAHSCFLKQSIDGTYNSTMVDRAAVSSWVNLGTSAKNVTMATGSVQPMYRTNVVNGQPMVRCDGGDRLTAATATDWTFLSNGTTNYTVTGSGRWTTTANSTMVSTSTSASTCAGVPLPAYCWRGSGSQTSNTFISDGAGAIVNATSSASTLLAQSYHSFGTQLADDGGAGVDMTVYIDGTSRATAVRSGAFSAVDGGVLGICAGPGGANPHFGDVGDILIYQSALDATQRGINLAVDAWSFGGTMPVTAATTPKTSEWLYVGNSLTSGGTGGERWPNKLTPLPSGISNIVVAISGSNAASSLSQWRFYNPPYPPRVFVLSGINDIIAGTSAVATFAILSTLYAEAKAAGVNVVAMTHPPFGNYVSWSAPKQAELIALNALVMASADVDVKVDLYAVMGQSGTPEDLDAAYDSGDGLHPNDAGTAFMAAAVATALGL
jgi:lysophospholipase L1-like esterase